MWPLICDSLRGKASRGHRRLWPRAYPTPRVLSDHHDNLRWISGLRCCSFSMERRQARLRRLGHICSRGIKTAVEGFLGACSQPATSLPPRQGTGRHLRASRGPHVKVLAKALLQYLSWFLKAENCQFSTPSASGIHSKHQLLKVS